MVLLKNKTFIENENSGYLLHVIFLVFIQFQRCLRLRNDHYLGNKFFSNEIRRRKFPRELIG